LIFAERWMARMLATGGRLAVVLALVLGLSGCAGEKRWMKFGAGPAEANEDEMSCAAFSEGGSGIAIGDTGFAPPRDQFADRYACLRSRGYKLVTLAPEEVAKLNSLDGIARETYWRELQQKHGVAQ
jgi:Flp pilus assembly protein TadD